MIKKWKRFYPLSPWWNIYKEYQKFDTRVVQVLDVQKDSFEMEDINGENLKDCIFSNYISFEQKQDILRDVVDIVNNIFKFKHQDCHLFWHDDLQLKNFMYTKNNEVRLIDPDSFTPISFHTTFHYEFETGKFFNTINNLHMSLIK
jgi:thiamine kinase-like enzyme